MSDNDVVFILGAGASRQCGGPLMSDFLDMAQDLLISGALVPTEREAFEKVFKAISGLYAVHSKAKLDTYNIETVFTAFELAQIIQRLPGTARDEIPDRIEALKAVIARTLELSIKFPYSDYSINAPGPYNELAELIHFIVVDRVPKYSVSIITFNYDIAIDIALLRAQLQPDYKIPMPAPMHSHFRPLALLKLHGSLNWAVEDSEQETIKPVDLDHYLAPGIRLFSPLIGGKRNVIQQNTYIPLSPHLQEYFAKNHSTRVKKLPYIVPPSWNKADYHKGLTDVWAAAADQLSRAAYVIVIGYSLPETDSFFRQLYALGSAGEARLRNFLVFDPDPGVHARFKDLMGTGVESRYKPEAFSFFQAIQVLKRLFGMDVGP
jgi:hypothetical protein